MKTIRAFTWGYWGWGSESKHFVRAVDWMEKKRGFLPPVFVDLRLARGGRAANFKGREFENIVGSRRYVWMPKLGNRRIKTKKGKPIQIADPTAAKDLLDLVVDKVKNRRRVIMFCACEEPILKMDDGFPSCHRVEVASLLLKAARRRGLKLELSEWPGESPVSIRVKADDLQQRALATGARYIPIGSVDSGLPSMAVLGWGSNVRFDTPQERWTVVTGPASIAKDRWRLEVVHDGTFTGKGAETSARKRGESLLRGGYGPRLTSRRDPFST
jgi:hypothetical protein